MYSAYFINTRTGELLHTSNPKDNPKLEEWKRIPADEYEVYMIVAARYSMLSVMGKDKFDFESERVGIRTDDESQCLDCLKDFSECECD